MSTVIRRTCGRPDAEASGSVGGSSCAKSSEAATAAPTTTALLRHRCPATSIRLECTVARLPTAIHERVFGERVESLATNSCRVAIEVSRRRPHRFHRMVCALRRNSSKADSNGPEWAFGDVIDSQRILVRATSTRFGNASGAHASSQRKACFLRSSARGPRIIMPARDPDHSIDLRPPRAPPSIQRSGCNINELPCLTQFAPQRMVRMRPPRSELSIYAAHRRSSAVASFPATNHCHKRKDSEIVRHAWYCQ